MTFHKKRLTIDIVSDINPHMEREIQNGNGSAPGEAYSDSNIPDPFLPGVITPAKEIEWAWWEVITENAFPDGLPTEWNLLGPLPELPSADEILQAPPADDREEPDEVEIPIGKEIALAARRGAEKLVDQRVARITTLKKAMQERVAQRIARITTPVSEAIQAKTPLVERVAVKLNGHAHVELTNHKPEIGEGRRALEAEEETSLQPDTDTSQRAWAEFRYRQSQSAAPKTEVAVFLSSQTDGKEVRETVAERVGLKGSIELPPEEPEKNPSEVSLDALQEKGIHIAAEQPPI